MFTLKAILPHAGAFAVALVVLIGARFAAGSERGPRIAGAGLAVGFLVGVSLVSGFGWSGLGLVSRIGHIALGAALAGLALDWLKPGRTAQGIVLGIFAVGCGWASALDGLIPKTLPSLMQLGLAVLLALLWVGMMVRFSALSTHRATSLVVVIAATTGLAWLAAIADDAALRGVALCLMAAVFALAVASSIFAIELGSAAMTPVAAAVVAMAWALAQRQPETLIGLPVLALVLFAERTARRVPMPGGRISAYLYLAVLAAFCAIPVVIAAVLVSAGVSV